MRRYYKNKKKVLYEHNYYLISINCYLKKSITFAEVNKFMVFCYG